jgi:hypothetical protein
MASFALDPKIAGQREQISIVRHQGKIICSSEDVRF